MNIIDHIRNKQKLHRLLLVVIPVVFLIAAATLLFSDRQWLREVLSGNDHIPSIESVATIDIDFNKEKSVYVSSDGSYIGLFTDKGVDNKRKENAFMYMLVPLSQFKENNTRSSYGGTVKGRENLPYRTYDYPDHGKYYDEETEWGADCSLIPAQVGRDYVQVSAGCGEGNELRSFRMDAAKTSAPDADLPLYFNGSSVYESPLSDCATYSTDANESKKICAESEDIHRVSFTNEKTQHRATWSLSSSVTETRTGFLDDGRFYVFWGKGYLWGGVYVIPRRYFVDDL